MNNSYIKNRYRRLISIFLVVTMLLITGCTAPRTPVDEDKILIVTTIFPEYDWVQTILGDDADNVELILLLDNGVDLHSFQPTADDILNISTCDLFIYVGGESDKWVDDALAEATNKDMKVIDLLDVLGDSVKEEEIVEGMQAEEEEEDEDEIEYDEHVWLSLKNASILVQSISDAICEIDPDNKAKYEANTTEYIDSIKKLDDEYATAIDEGSKDTVVFGDRFPFRYMVDDYGLDYYAAFSGCSAESGASFETVVFLADKLDELSLDSIFVIENSNEDIARSIIDNTDTHDQQILRLDSMQGTTSADVKSGVTYLSIMESNLEVLKQGLK